MRGADLRARRVTESLDALRRERKAALPPVDPALATSRVLIVDDSPVNRNLLVRYLARAGITLIEQAENGADGLAKVASFRPDLVLLDVNMPVMGGREMCRRLRARLETADLPVLFQTAEATESEQLACFQAGGSDYIVKPIRRGECVARVTVHLQNRRMVLALRAYASPHDGGLQDRDGRALRDRSGAARSHRQLRARGPDLDPQRGGTQRRRIRDQGRAGRSRGAAQDDAIRRAGEL